MIPITDSLIYIVIYGDELQYASNAIVSIGQQTENRCV